LRGTNPPKSISPYIDIKRNNSTKLQLTRCLHLLELNLPTKKNLKGIFQASAKKPQIVKLDPMPAIWCLVVNYDKLISHHFYSRKQQRFNSVILTIYVTKQKKIPLKYHQEFYLQLGIQQ
jgi:hypothetical protein